MKLWQVALLGVVFSMLIMGFFAWLVLTLFQPRRRGGLG